MRFRRKSRRTAIDNEPCEPLDAVLSGREFYKAIRSRKHPASDLEVLRDRAFQETRRNHFQDQPFRGRCRKALGKARRNNMMKLKYAVLIGAALLAKMGFSQSEE